MRIPFIGRRGPSPEQSGPQPDGAAAPTPEQDEQILTQFSKEAVEAKFKVLEQANNLQPEPQRQTVEQLWTEAIFELRQDQIAAEGRRNIERLTTQSRWQKFFESKPGKAINFAATVAVGTATNIKIRSALAATVGFGWAAATASGMVGGAIGGYKAGRAREKEAYQAEKIGQELGIAELNDLVDVSKTGDIGLNQENEAKITKALQVIDALMERGKLFGSKDEIERLIDKRVDFQAILETKRTLDRLSQENQEEIDQAELPAKIAQAFEASQQEHLAGSDQTKTVFSASPEAKQFLKEKSRSVNWARIKGGIIGAGFGAAVSGTLTHFFHPASGFGGGEIDSAKAAENATLSEKFRTVVEKLSHGYLHNDQTALAEAKRTIIERNIDYSPKLAEGLRELVTQHETLVSPTGAVDDQLVKAMYEMMSYPDELIPLAQSVPLEQLGNDYWVHHLSPVAQETTKQWHQFAGSYLAMGNYLIAPASALGGMAAPYITPQLTARPSAQAVLERFRGWMGERRGTLRRQSQETTLEYQDNQKDVFVRAIGRQAGGYLIIGNEVFQVQRLQTAEDFEQAKQGKIKVKKAVVDAERNVAVAADAPIEWTAPTPSVRIVKTKERVKELLQQGAQ